MYILRISFKTLLKKFYKYECNKSKNQQENPQAEERWENNNYLPNYLVKQWGSQAANHSRVWCIITWSKRIQPQCLQNNIVEVCGQNTMTHNGSHYTMREPS